MGDHPRAREQNNIQLVLLSIMNCDVRRATFQLHKCSKTVWRPGSARTRWGAHSAPPDPLAGRRGPLRGGRGKGGRGRERKGRERREGKGKERKGRKEREGFRFSPPRTLNSPRAEWCRISTVGNCGRSIDWLHYFRSRTPPSGRNWLKAMIDNQKTSIGLTLKRCISDKKYVWNTHRKP
jgi:hypothetical protein